MAVYVQKSFNKSAGAIPEGVAVTFSSTGYFMYVLDLKGNELARFRSGVVMRYWIEEFTESALAEPVSGMFHQAPARPSIS